MQNPHLIQESAIDKEIGALWDFVVRVSNACLFVLLVVAYATGEEFQHTHAMIGYGIAALVIAGIFWEVLRPHHSRYIESFFHPPKIKELFQKATGQVTHVNKMATAVFLMAMVIVVAVIALFALVLMFVTHNFYSATDVDEMHEVVAYFALGLVAFHVAVLIVIRAEQIDSSKNAPAK